LRYGEDKRRVPLTFVHFFHSCVTPQCKNPKISVKIKKKSKVKKEKKAFFPDI
jgi:hypothetical protein